MYYSGDEVNHIRITAAMSESYTYYSGDEVNHICISAAASGGHVAASLSMAALIPCIIHVIVVVMYHIFHVYYSVCQSSCV